VATGIAGAPVFAEGGDIRLIFKPTFGYLIGFIVVAYVISRIRENVKELTFIKILFAFLFGLFFIYLFRVVYLYISYN
jgi:biotin transport system substrate-specific component